MIERFLSLQFLLFVFLLGSGLAVGIVASLPDEKLHVVACDVGQGDAVLVSLGSTQLLVDGGPDSRVVSCLSRYMPFWDRTLEVVVLTHPQADHLNGLVEVLEDFEVERVIVSGVRNDTAGFRAFREAVEGEGALVHFAARGDQIRMGEVKLVVLWPEKESGLARRWEEYAASAGSAVLGAATPDVNEASVVLHLSFGAFDALLTGDIGFASEEALLGEEVLEPVEALKVAHHGSKYSTSSDFLGEVRPQLAVVSAGANNRYGHPSGETLMRLEGVGAKILRTDERGDIKIVSDGEGYWVEE